MSDSHKKTPVPTEVRTGVRKIPRDEPEDDKGGFDRLNHRGFVI